MADLPSHPDTNDRGVGPEPSTGTSRWKSVVGVIVAIVVVALFIALHLTGVLGPGGH